jgi:hypothetical protein
VQPRQVESDPRQIKRESRLEEKVIMGPPTKRTRLNRKTGKLEIDNTWTDPDDAA